MTPQQLKAIRRKLGLSVVDFGRALGYIGNDNSISVTVRRYESDRQDIPPRIAARATDLYRKMCATLCE